MGETRIPISQVLNFIDLVFNFSVSCAGLLTVSYFLVLSIPSSLFSCIILMAESLLISLCQMSLLFLANQAFSVKTASSLPWQGSTLSEMLWWEACCQFLKDRNWIIPSPVPTQMGRLEEGFAIFTVSLFKAQFWGKKS